MALLIWCWSKSVAHVWWSSNVVDQVDFGHFQVMDLLVVSLSEFTSPLNPFGVHLLFALCGMHLLLALSGTHFLLASSNQSLVCSGDGLADGVPQQLHIPLATFFGVHLLLASSGVHLLLASSGVHLLLASPNQSLVCLGDGLAGGVPQQLHIPLATFFGVHLLLASSGVHLLLASSGVHLLLASPNQSLVCLGDGLAGGVPQQVRVPLATFFGVHLLPASSGVHLLLASLNQSPVCVGDGLAGRVSQQVHLPLESLGLQASGGLWRE